MKKPEIGRFSGSPPEIRRGCAAQRQRSRSDSGRAAARGWSEGCTKTCHSSVSYRGRVFAARNVRLEVSARAGRTTPALAPGPPSLCQRPPLLSRGGNCNVQSQNRIGTIISVLNPQPKTRAERTFHPGGAGAPAHAACREEPILNFFTAPLFKAECLTEGLAPLIDVNLRQERAQD